MLKVLRLDKVIQERIFIDQYKPIKIKLGSWSIINEKIIYWRIGDFKKSLAEVGIASKSGLIRWYLFEMVL